MSEIIAKALNTTAILRDQSLASSQRAPQALQTLSGLMLSDLSLEAQANLETELVLVQRILTEAQIGAAEDYETLSSAAIDEVVRRIETACHIAIDSETQRVMSGLDAALHRLPREEIEEVRRHPEVFVPLLIESVKDAVASARQGSQREGQSHFFAAFLLVELKVSDAVPLLLAGFKLHGHRESEIFGDAIHSLFPRMLAIFSHGETDDIDQLLRDMSLDEFARWGALSTYCMLVGDGVLPREEAIAKLESHLAWCIEQEDFDLIAPIVCELGNLGAREAWKTIETAYDRGLVDPAIVDRDFIESQLADPVETLRTTLKDHVPSSSFDTIEELSSWASFRERPHKDRVSSVDRSPSHLPASTSLRFDPPVEVEPTEPVPTRKVRVGRNEPCPCGSGKKYKRCCRA